jgi:hypothetical protein
MLFLMYWELNEEISGKDRLKAVEKLKAAGLFPPENIEMLRFDVTPDYWGITLVNADTVADVSDFINMWRIACPGMFKTTKISPARPVQESLAAASELIEKIQQD